MVRQQLMWLGEVKDPKVKQASVGIQLPLMLKLMQEAGMEQVTIDFVKKVLTEGGEYIDDVDSIGLYDVVQSDEAFGNYEYKEPPKLRKVWDVRPTVLASEHVRVPDKYTDIIHRYTLQGVDIATKGSLPPKTPLGPYHALQTLPSDTVIPAFRFWVPQDVSTGADEGRTVDDLTASGG